MYPVLPGAGVNLAKTILELIALAAMCCVFCLKMFKGSSSEATLRRLGKRANSIRSSLRGARAMEPRAGWTRPSCKVEQEALAAELQLDC